MGSELDGDRARKAERLSIDAPARLRPNDWSNVEVTMLDLSELGFRARCEARLQPGGSVSLDVPGVGPVEAQVEWCKAHQFGARFYVPIDLGCCRWTLSERREALAELLVERSRARRSGRRTAEAPPRQKLLADPARAQGNAA